MEHVNRAGTESFEQTELPDAVTRVLVLGTEINGLLTALLEEGQAEGAYGGILSRVCPCMSCIRA